LLADGGSIPPASTNTEKPGPRPGFFVSGPCARFKPSK